jgi:hypothetical protein
MNEHLELHISHFPRLPTASTQEIDLPVHIEIPKTKGTWNQMPCPKALATLLYPQRQLPHEIA